MHLTFSKGCCISHIHIHLNSIILFSISSQCVYLCRVKICTSSFNYTENKAILNLIKSLQYNLRSYKMRNDRRVWVWVCGSKHRVLKLFTKKSGDVFQINVHYSYHFDKILFFITWITYECETRCHFYSKPINDFSKQIMDFINVY